MVRPSYKSGYARSAGEAVNPGLWKTLIGAWPTSLGRTGGTLRDVSTYRNHGTLNNMELDLDWVSTGRNDIALALDFDGSNEYVSIGAGVFPIGNSPRTISFWFNTDSFPTGNSEIIIGQSGAGTFGAGFQIGPEDGAISVSWTGHRTISPKSALNTGQWYHLAVLIPPGSTTTAQSEMWIDGVQQSLSSEAGSSRTLNTADQSVNFGADHLAGNFYNGRLADVLVFSSALTGNEIRTLATDPLGLLRRKPRVVSFPAAAAAEPFLPYHAREMNDVLIRM